MARKEEQKKFLGMPMNWDRKQPFKGLWDAESDNLFPPKNFGIGWTINFHAMFRKLGIIKTSENKETKKTKGSQ